MNPQRVVPLLMLVVACGHFNRIGISVAGSEQIIPQYHLDPEKMGLVYSAFLLSYSLAMIPGGWFIDRFGARTALLLLGLGSTLFVAATGGVGFVASDASTLLLGLLVIRSLLGIVNAPLHPASARMVFEFVPARSKAMANGLVTFAACVGMASAYYLFGTLIDGLGWPTAFLIASGLTLLMTVVWVLTTQQVKRSSPSETRRPEAAPDFAALKQVLCSRSVVCITLSYALYGYFQYLFFYWIGYYFETIEQQNRGVARGYSTLITLAMGVGMVSGGWLADRVPTSFSPRTRRALVPVVGMITSGIIFELGLLGPNATFTLVAFGFAAALIGACEGAFWTTVVELGGRFGGTTAGLMNTGGNIGGALSPFITPLMGSLFTRYYGRDLGWRISLAIAGGIVVVGALLWRGIEPPESSQDAPETEEIDSETAEILHREPFPSST